MGWDNSFYLWGILLLSRICNDSLFLCSPAPEGKAQWESMAWLYLAGMATCSLLAVALIASIMRKRLKKSIKQPEVL